MSEQRARLGFFNRLSEIPFHISFNQWLLVIFLLSFLSRVVVIFLLSNFSHISGMENEAIALNILHGKGYSYRFLDKELPSAYMSPVYTLFLYLHFLFFGERNYFWVELSQALIGSFSAVLLVLIGKKLINEKVGIFSGLLFAFYPIYVYWVTRAQQLVIDIFLLELSIYCVIWSFQKESSWRHLLAGMVMGLTALSKTFYLSFPAFYWLWIWLWKKPGIRKAFLIAGLWACGCIIVIMPWMIRNYRTFGEIIPITTNGGVNLWIGNNPKATGGLYTKEQKPII